MGLSGIQTQSKTISDKKGHQFNSIHSGQAFRFSKRKLLENHFSANLDKLIPSVNPPPVKNDPMPTELISVINLRSQITRKTGV